MQYCSCAIETVYAGFEGFRMVLYFFYGLSLGSVRQDVPIAIFFPAAQTVMVPRPRRLGGTGGPGTHIVFRSLACPVGARKLRFCLVSAVYALQEMLASVFQTQMFVGLIFWVKLDHLFKCQKQKASSSAKCPGKCHL